MVIAVGSSCSHMIKMVRFWSDPVAGSIRADFESNRSNFDPERKSDSFAITMWWFMYYLMYYFSKHSVWRNPHRIRNRAIKTTVSKYLRSAKIGNEPCWDLGEVKPTRCRSGPDTEKSCILRLHLKNYISGLRTHFLDLGLGWGLYIHYQDIARALRSFLVVISASRPLCGRTFTSRSIIDMCSREISNPHIIESLIFSIRIRHVVDLIDRTDPSGRGLSLRTMKSIHKWFRRTENRSRWF